MNKYAYLQGVNLYGNGNNLRGCVNDVMDMRERLVEKYKFQPDNIRMLTDYRATTKAELEHLDWLIACCSSTEQDYLFFDNSSHGTRFRIRDASGNLNQWESDVICPSDFDWDKNFISVEMLHEKFDKIPPNTTLFFMSDSCCSGNLVRELMISDLPPRLPKFMIPPEDIRSRSIGQKMMQNAINSYVSKIDSVNVIFLSGCQSEQTSADAYIDGRFNGALTAGMKRVMDNLPEVHYLMAHDEIHKFLNDRGFDQEPELKARDHLLLSMIFGGVK